MSQSKEKDEIVVKAPSKPVTPPEKKAEKDVERALEEERFGVLQISRKVGTSFGASMLAAGILLLSLLTYALLTSQTGWMILPSETAFLTLIVWIFAGIVNIVGGLLLIGSE